MKFCSGRLAGFNTGLIAPGVGFNEPQLCPPQQITVIGNDFRPRRDPSGPFSSRANAHLLR